jgi:hypothetical protein
MSATIWPFSAIRNPNTPFIRVVLLGWLTATIPAIILVQIVSILLPPEAGSDIAEQLFPEELPFWISALGVVVFAPLVETGLMAIVFFLTRKLGASTPVQIGIQVVFWAFLHGIQAPLWAFGPGWIFFVLALIWTGQRKASFGRAFWSVTLVHALNNAIATLAIAAETFAA